MKRAYQMIVGNSRITPIGVAVAVAVTALFGHALGWWQAPVYLALLLLTLAATTLEPVQ
jgi:hypothetical protein